MPIIKLNHGHLDDMIDHFWWGWVSSDGEPWTWECELHYASSLIL